MEADNRELTKKKKKKKLDMGKNLNLNVDVVESSGPDVQRDGYVTKGMEGVV